MGRLAPMLLAACVGCGGVDGRDGSDAFLPPEPALAGKWTVDRQGNGLRECGGTLAIVGDNRHLAGELRLTGTGDCSAQFSLHALAYGWNGVGGVLIGRVALNAEYQQMLDGTFQGDLMILTISGDGVRYVAWR